MTRKSTLLSTAVIMAMFVAGPVLAQDSEDASAAPAPAPAMHKEWKGGHPGEWHLSAEKRKMIHAAMESLHQKNEALWEKKFDLKEELHAMMKAPKFDADAFLAKKEQLDALSDQGRKNREETFAQLASKLDAHERMMLMMMHHGHGHGGGHGGHGHHFG